ncbi:hypothetical protein GINT2_001438 [Glugoides intestinalis]
MTCAKHRYLILKVYTKEKEICPITIKNSIYNSLKFNFGEYVLSMICCFEVIECYPNLAVLTIKCDLDLYKYICYCINTIGTINGTNTKLSVISTSGILRKAKKRLLEFEKANKI